MSGDNMRVIPILSLWDRGGRKKAKGDDRSSINMITQNSAATDLLVFLLQETIVPLVRGNPGSTLLWIHCDKFLQLLCWKTQQISCYR